MSNLAINIPHIARHITSKSGIDRNNFDSLLQVVRIIDVHPAEDPVFPKPLFLNIIEAHTTQLVVQHEVGDRDETVTESRCISASEGTVR